MLRNIKIDGLDKEAILWRYMDLSKFVSLLATKSIWLARADKFKDQSEGKFHLEMEETLKQVYAKFELNENDKIKDENDFQKFLIHNAYLSCWHKNDHENMAMWEIYSQSTEAVAIKTTVEKFSKSLDITKYKRHFVDLTLGNVDYRSPDEIKGKLKYKDPFFIKRPHFKYESEVRLFLSSYSSYEPCLETPVGYSVPIDLSTSITEIVVHPDAQDWFLNSVQELVKKFGLKTTNVTKGLCGNSS